jgi:hypothetical protein
VDATPSLAAWAALGVLWLLLASGAWTAEVRRRMSWSHSTSRAPFPRWTRRAFRTIQWLSAAIALVPGVIGLVIGASWEEVAWWLLVGLAAGSVLGLVISMSVGALWLLTKRWRGLPREERIPSLAWAALFGAPLLCIPVIVTACLAADAGLPLAVALALSLAYAVWQATYRVSRRWTLYQGSDAPALDPVLHCTDNRHDHPGVDTVETNDKQ